MRNKLKNLLLIQKPPHRPPKLLNLVQTYNKLPSDTNPDYIYGRYKEAMCDNMYDVINQNYGKDQIILQEKRRQELLLS